MNEMSTLDRNLITVQFKTVMSRDETGPEYSVVGRGIYADNGLFYADPLSQNIDSQITVSMGIYSRLGPPYTRCRFYAEAVHATRGECLKLCFVSKLRHKQSLTEGDDVPMTESKYARFMDGQLLNQSITEMRDKATTDCSKQCSLEDCFVD